MKKLLMIATGVALTLLSACCAAEMCLLPADNSGVPWWLNQATYINVFSVLTSIIGTASVIAKLTPTKNDDRIVSNIKNLLDLIALNDRNAGSQK